MKIYKHFAVTIIPLVALLITTSVLLDTEAATGHSEQIDVSLPMYEVTVRQDAGGLARFAGEHLQQMGETGEPAVPYVEVTFLLPPDADLSTINASIINPRWEEIANEWDVPPVPPIATRDGENEIVIWPEGKNIINGRDVDIYTNDAIFPSQTIGRMDTLVVRQRNMAQVFYAAYKYNPVHKTLYRLSSAALQITFNRVAQQQSAPSAFDSIGLEQIEKLSVNFDEMIGEYGGRAPSSPGIYVIITTTAIEAASTQLANFVTSKQARGFTVQVVTQGTWGGDTGDDAAENIRSWLQDNYLGLNIEYVLLIGNPHPENGDVPMKMLWPRNNATFETSYKEAPSDFYYAELTSSWDDDGDGKYGEYDHDFGNNPPRGAEVIVGRIPYYGNTTDLDSILTKIITYENTPEIDALWRQNTLLPMEPSDDSTPAYHLGEAIKDDILGPRVWEYHRVYDDAYFGLPIPIPKDTETVPCNVGNVTSAWNNDAFGAIFWWTHGSSTGASDVMDTSNAATLDDEYPGFTFQCSCLNGQPETTTNLGYSLLKNGGIGTVSAGRVSWYYIGQTSFAGSPSPNPPPKPTQTCWAC